jgi:hypothetical protein
VLMTTEAQTDSEAIDKKQDMIWFAIPIE